MRAQLRVRLREFMVRHVWLWVAIALVLGAQAPVWVSSATVVALWLLGRWRLWAKRPVWLLTAAVLGGALSAESTVSFRLRAPRALPTPLSGEVVSADLAVGGARITVSPDGDPANRVRVSLPARPLGVAPGARVLVTGRLRTPAPDDNPGTLDFGSWCARRRIALVGAGNVEVLEPAGDFAEGVVRVREAARRAILGTQPAEGGALLLGLLLGDQGALPAWIREAFEATGTSHLLSVSGIHISGVALLAFAAGRALGRRLGLSRPEVSGALFALPASVLFVALSQFPVAGVRSGLMVALSLVARLLARRADGRNVLGLTALLVLADDPGLAVEPAFQLSFLAVLALVLFGGEDEGLPGLLRASLAASLITLPVQCAHFGTVAPLAPLANLLIVPLASVVVVPLGLLALIVSPLAPELMQLAAHLALGLSCVTEVLSQASGGLWVPGAWAAPLLALPGLLAVLYPVLGPIRCLLAALVLVPAGLALRPPDTTCDFLAVGQGDAILVRSAGQTLLVDAGPEPDAVALRAFLRYSGVSRLDAVAITHAHPDHFLGLVALARAVPIGALYTNGHLAVGEHGAGLARELAALKLVPQPPPAPVFRLGALWITTLNLAPPPDASENDASLVFRLDGPGGSVLLTGDIEAETEGRLAHALGALGPVDVIKAPHHGSRTSSTPHLLNRLHPRAVVFTVGRENRFHFPRPQVQMRYAALNAAQWRTDTDGAVRVEFDERGLVMGAHHRSERQRLDARRPVRVED